MKYLGIIPARYASTRFPGKPLALIGGKPIIQRVYEQVKDVFDTTIIATDDERIAKCVEEFGGRAVMTDTNHNSGTDRCYEAYVRLGEKCDVIVNIQGDEPFIRQSQLESVKNCFNDNSTQIATLVKPFDSTEGFDVLANPNSPKVLINKQNQALYFSRSVVPFLRGVPQDMWLKNHTFYKHIGLYAYRTDILREITLLPQSLLEQAESLEQLRWLENGYVIKVGFTNIETIGIDTPEDLKRAEQFFAETLK